jgi:hypothetical protein
MALRRRFSPVLPFGCRAILVILCRDFRPSGFVPPAFAGFAFFGNQAVMVFMHVRPLILRRQFSRALLFSKCNLIFARISPHFKQFRWVLRWF